MGARSRRRDGIGQVLDGDSEADWAVIDDDLSLIQQELKNILSEVKLELERELDRRIEKRRLDEDEARCEPADWWR